MRWAECVLQVVTMNAGLGVPDGCPAEVTWLLSPVSTTCGRASYLQAMLS